MIANKNAKPLFSDADLHAEAQRLLAATASKHGLTVDELNATHADIALEEARTNLERGRPTEDAQSFEALYKAEKLRADSLSTVVNTIKSQGNIHARANTGTSLVSMERARALIGTGAWAQLSIPARLEVCGIKESEVDTALVSRLFGRSTDSDFAVSFQRTNPSHYAKLREAALILNLTGR